MNANVNTMDFSLYRTDRLGQGISQCYRDSVGLGDPLWIHDISVLEG